MADHTRLRRVADDGLEPSVRDVGFQLSVAATAGLVLFSPDFENGLEALLRSFLRAETARRVTRWLPGVAVSFAAAATLPLTVLYFASFRSPACSPTP